MTNWCWCAFSMSSIFRDIARDSWQRKRDNLSSSKKLGADEPRVKRLPDACSWKAFSIEKAVTSPHHQYQCPKREDTAERQKCIGQQAGDWRQLTWSRWAASVVLGPGAVEAPLHSACSRSIPAHRGPRPPSRARWGKRPWVQTCAQNEMTSSKLDDYLVLRLSTY